MSLPEQSPYHNASGQTHKKQLLSSRLTLHLPFCTVAFSRTPLANVPVSRYYDLYTESGVTRLAAMQ